MAITLQYVVTHKGVEKLVTTDKKEADKYDKMLEIADNLAVYLSAKGTKLDDDSLEELAITLASGKDAVSQILRGKSADQVLTDEQADVVALKKRSA
ncbi:YebG family protein [Aestuariibacter salexigens]|uniref:YebG family protein n=1 Tax=Aestuariibacter salexigens TaxID=226010 RepID=UPI00041644D1|nr:YebG family protein [Aestuariibacter salexigens]